MISMPIKLIIAQIKMTLKLNTKMSEEITEMVKTIVLLISRDNIIDLL